jgi:alkaline phosphatase D
MKTNLIFLFAFFLLIQSCLIGQSYYCPEINQIISSNPSAFPFGVASGDPQANSVIIWTAINPFKIGSSNLVEWEIAKDEKFISIIQKKNLEIQNSSGYTVKINVGELESGTRYYYRFKYNNQYSPTGITKTLDLNPGKIKLAVVSCSNFEWGYFNAYKSISEIEDLDMVIHLGDYIYEYEQGKYASKKLKDRKHLPNKEIVTLEDYRSRYAQYRLDPDLQELHRRLPFVSIWDDHEIANDTYADGAQNHQENEGTWENRKLNSQQAYFEWLPIQDQSERKIRRKFSFGPLADLYMLDGRLEGRSKQVNSKDDPLLFDSSRTMLGKNQRDWLIEEVSNSKARWKIIGNQVIFSNYDYPQKLTLYSKSMDMWEGYPYERNLILNTWVRNDVRDLIILTGDVHAAFSMDLRQNIANSNTSIGREWVTTSITSASLNEYVPTWKTRIIENWFTQKGLNPHLDYLNFRDHGFLLVTLNQDKAIAEWHFEKNILKKKAKTSKNVRRELKHSKSPK